MLNIILILFSVNLRSAPVFRRQTNQKLPFYYPESVSGIPDQPSNFVQGSGADLDLAVATILEQIGASQADVVLDHEYTDNYNIHHFFFTRSVNGLKVSNQNAAVHIDSTAGTVVYFSASFSLQSNFVRRNIPVQTNMILCESEVVRIAESLLGISKDPTNSTLGYIEVPGRLVYAYTFQLRDKPQNLWFQVSVDAQTGELVQVIDYTSHASYQGIILPNTSPLDGFGVVTNPADKLASPRGWNSDGITNWTNTQGNNVDVHVSSNRAQGDANLNFLSSWNAALSPRTAVDQDASMKSIFYVLNTVHDILYQFGFDEKAGNFQKNNFGRGGLGNDRVVVNSQSSMGTNNANFQTPPDGQSGTMNMYLWSFSNPIRDGALDSFILIHEYDIAYKNRYTHGVSNRLTGGPSNIACLQSRESGGMGEGWSDAVAIYLTRKVKDSADKNVAIGYYAANRSPDSSGVRRFPYSTSLLTNPLIFSGVNSEILLHRIGEYWASMLYELYWNLRNTKGYSSNWNDARLNPALHKGNIIALQLVIGGMKLQPCNPTFTQARNAILTADINYYKGANKCLIWKAFAKRGLGVDSVQVGYKNGFKLPTGC